jgi:hypothetical protein
MSLELPVLRVGLAGFSIEQQEALRQMLPHASPSGLHWEFGKVNEADVLWINGARSQLLADGTLRIASGVPGGRSVQVDLAGMDRPVAFAGPLPRSFDPYLRFDAGQLASVSALIEKLELVLRPAIGQFCLASQILEQETALGSGVHHVTTETGRLLAVVNLRGDVGVLPTASPLEFEDAMWTAMPLQAGVIPPGFARVSLSQLMWQYALRTGRDVLPRRYRTETLYFRRPPRLPQRLLRDSHLLLLRELAVEPGRFADLQQRTGLVGPQMAQDLAALYLVGSITSNAKRAARLPTRRWTDSPDSLRSQGHSGMPSGLGSESGPQTLRPRLQDRTAPAPLSLE